jgi:hypothetical protein
MSISIFYLDNVQVAREGSLTSSALMSSPEASMSHQWARTVQKLRAMGRLYDDWDGLGATAPDRELVDNAEAFLALFRAHAPNSPPSRVIAGPNGTVVFGWQSPSMQLEAEIESPGVAEFVLEESGSAPQMWHYCFGAADRDAQWGTHSRIDSSAA